MENEKITPDDKIISSHIYDTDMCQMLKKNWSSNLNLETKNVHLSVDPFKTCKLKNFLRKPLGTYDLRGELLSVHNRKRGNDLMKLEESICDLQDITPEQTYSQNIECIKLLCTEFIRDLKPWLSTITGIEFNDKMAIRTSTYKDTDFLLCHNDKIEDRCIAFILYLSKDWKEEYGGKLNLFKSKNGIPTVIAKSLVPEYNTFIFFEVTNQSFHSVSEILENVSRFSVNGWFHGKIKSTPSSTPEETVCSSPPINTQCNLSTFIRDSRLSNSTFIEIINKVIEVTSFCGIKNYIKEEMYKDLLYEITSDKINWIKIGPPDQKNYEVVDVMTLPEKLKQLYYMFQSVFFCELLKQYTDLELVPDETNSPRLTVELQRWHQGCYTILHDSYIKNTKEDKIQVESEESENEEIQMPKQTKKMNNRKNGKTNYTVKDMLQDIIVDSNDVSSILSFLPHSINEDEVNDINEPGPSNSVICNDDGPSAIKRSRFETDETDENLYIKEKDKDVDAESENDSQTKGTLDVVLYFHSGNAPEGTTLNYVDPGREDGVFLTLPIKDNSLFIVFRQNGVVRHNEYVNHYCKGNFYSLVCSYTE